MTVSATMCQISIQPPKASTASAMACSISSTWVASIMRWRLKRSDQMPATGASSSTGRLAAKLNTPSSVAEPVSL